MTAATGGTVRYHAGPEDLSRLGAHAPPPDFSSTYPRHALDTAEEAFEAGDLAETEPIYARLVPKATAAAVLTSCALAVAS